MMELDDRVREVESDSGCSSWWTRGQLSVCCVRWYDSRVKTAKEFCRLLKHQMPKGTEILGRKVVNDYNENRYVVLLGFSFRLGSWQGLEDRLVLKFDDGSVAVDEDHIDVEFVDDGLEQLNADQFVRYMVEHLMLELEGDIFGDSLSVKSACLFEATPLVNTAEEMWDVEKKKDTGTKSES